MLILAFVDQLTDKHREQVVVLIPVAVPDRPWYRSLHNHLDVVQPRRRELADVVTVRVPMPLHIPDSSTRCAC